MSMKKRTPLGWIWLFLAPTIILYGIYTIYPIITTVRYSFMNWSGFSAHGSYVGFENYVELFQDDLFGMVSRTPFFSSSMLFLEDSFFPSCWHWCLLQPLRQ